MMNATGDEAITHVFSCVEIALQQASHNLPLRDCILLENESTVHAFCNEYLVMEIVYTPESLDLGTDGVGHPRHKNFLLRT